MSKMDSIVRPDANHGAFAASYERLQAVESVVGIISDMTRSDQAHMLQLPDQAQLAALYQHGSPMVRDRFDAICNELAVIARSGTQALLQLKMEGRTNLDAAAGLLMWEIKKTSGQITALLHR